MASVAGKSYRIRSVGGVERYAHRLVAEAALGRALPLGSEVHHVDGNVHNNTGENLVICQDKAYHKLLHYRERVLRAGGSPNTDAVCCRCGQAKPLDAFSRTRRKISTGRQSACKSCHEMYRRDRKRAA